MVNCFLRGLILILHLSLRSVPSPTFYQGDMVDRIAPRFRDARSSWYALESRRRADEEAEARGECVCSAQGRFEGPTIPVGREAGTWYKPGGESEIHADILYVPMTQSVVDVP